MKKKKYDGQSKIEEERRRSTMNGVTGRKKEEEVRWTAKHGGRKQKQYDGRSDMEEERRRSMMNRVTWRMKGLVTRPHGGSRRRCQSELCWLQRRTCEEWKHKAGIFVSQTVSGSIALRLVSRQPTKANKLPLAKTWLITANYKVASPVVDDGDRLDQGSAGQVGETKVGEQEVGHPSHRFLLPDGGEHNEVHDNAEDGQGHVEDDHQGPT